MGIFSFRVLHKLVLDFIESEAPFDAGQINFFAFLCILFSIVFAISFITWYMKLARVRSNTEIRSSKLRLFLDLKFQSRLLMETFRMAKGGMYFTAICILVFVSIVFGSKKFALFSVPWYAFFTIVVLVKLIIPIFRSTSTYSEYQDCANGAQIVNKKDAPPASSNNIHIQ